LFPYKKGSFAIFTNALTRMNNLFPSYAVEFSIPLNDLFDNEWETKMTVTVVNVAKNNDG
jgi:hypothetical protein